VSSSVPEVIGRGSPSSNSAHAPRTSFRRATVSWSRAAALHWDVDDYVEHVGGLRGLEDHAMRGRML
jgi:hypothetical protein